MSLTRLLTRSPRAYDSAAGSEARSAAPDFGPEIGALLAGAGGSSPFLKELIAQEAAWLETAVPDPDAALANLHEDLTQAAPGDLAQALRQAKRRVALITALADLGGAWPLHQVTGVLTRFADLACDLAIKSHIRTQITRSRLPGQSEDDVAQAAGLVILAMGKMGAGELNYSSDIDLICLFDETRFEPDTYMEARQGFVRATRAMTAMLSDRTAEGYVFRTDLRLRPDPAVTPVCIAMEAAERYYESLGRTWERAAFIKARPAAGDLHAGARFLEALRPFIWRRHLDFAAIQDAHDIRLRIRETKATARGADMAGRDLKLGQGGIREIEFFTQTRQLIAGGRDPSLRERGTVAGLAALAAGGWVPEAASTELSTQYVALREAEHRIQMVNDAQTHSLPRNEEALGRVAALAGMDPVELVEDLRQRMTAVHDLTERFFAPDTKPEAPPDPVPGLDPDIISRWPTYPALRSERAAHIFDRLRPELLHRLARSARPDQALVALDEFLAGLPAGVQLFSLFEANPQLIDLLVDIVGTSPALANHLARNASVFDAVIGGAFFADWPGEAALLSELSAQLGREPDYEARLDMARRWTREWHFRIGVHLLRGLIDAETAGRHYADLAGAVLMALYPVVADQFAVKHGPPPGRGAVVLGMGSLGARRLNATSDLDVIVIYDPREDEMSDGPRPLATRPYYARLTQALITAMSAPMSQGRLYEVDMRLRPSGTQGPVATSRRSFQDYQRDQAWVWEHLALTRARIVAGDPGLGADIEAFRRDLLNTPRARDTVLQDVAQMRDRIAAAKPTGDVFDVKTGAGRLQDIELIAQAGALLSGTVSRDVAAGLQGGVAVGWLDAADADALGRAYDLFWSVVIAARLISSAPLTTENLGEGGAAFLCRATGQDDIDTLRAALTRNYDRTAQIIARAVSGDRDGQG